MLKGLLNRFSSFLKALFSTRYGDQTERLMNRAKKRITNLSDEKLESAILHYVPWYFQYIGEHHPEVVAFKAAVDTRNIQLIAKKWLSFASQFVKYERLAGNISRPYIMDCYFTYELYLEEYRRRQENK